MAAIPFPGSGDFYPFATTATTSYVFYVDASSTASTWPVYAPAIEFVPGRRQPVWADEPHKAKSFVVKQNAAKCYVMQHPRNGQSRCQMRRQKRKNRLQSLS